MNLPELSVLFKFVPISSNTRVNLRSFPAFIHFWWIKKLLNFTIAGEPTQFTIEILKFTSWKI